MARTREQIMEERRRLKKEYGELFDSVASLLYRADPIGIGFENPHLDEYAPEAGTILPRLRTCNSADDVLRVVYEEFCRWFGVETAGGREHYQGIATDIWELWLRSTQLPSRSS
jgi:hypothetical protein